MDDDNASHSYSFVHGARRSDLQCSQWSPQHIGLARKIQCQACRSFGKWVRFGRRATRDKKEEPRSCHETTEALHYSIHKGVKCKRMQNSCSEFEPVEIYFFEHISCFFKTRREFAHDHPFEKRRDVGLHTELHICVLPGLFHVDEEA